MINSVRDLTDALSKISNQENIVELVEPVFDYDILSSTNSKILNSHDDELRDTVEQLELCLPYYLYFDSGVIIKTAESKLKKIGFNVNKINISDYGFTHAVSCDKFSIMFTV